MAKPLQIWGDVDVDVVDDDGGNNDVVDVADPT